jgi:hypothetical protein
VTQDHLDFASVLERVSTFYLRKFDQELPLDHPARPEGPLGSYLNYAGHVNALLESGKYKHAKKEGMQDTFDDIMVASAW